MLPLRRSSTRGDREGSRGRLSYANVVSTMALIVAIGGGTALAASQYVITSKSQIKPEVLKKLHGPRGKRGPRGTSGTNGTNGTNGKNGATGPSGSTGPTGVIGATGPAGAGGIATGTASNVTLSAFRGLVVSATASTSGHQLVIAQVAAHRATPQTAGDSIGCVLNNLTAAPGTDVGPATATFPGAGAFSSFVDLSLESVIASSPGDTIAVSCTGGNLGFVVDNANITLIPLP